MAPGRCFQSSTPTLIPTVLILPVVLSSVQIALQSHPNTERSPSDALKHLFSQPVVLVLLTMGFI